MPATSDSAAVVPTAERQPKRVLETSQLVKAFGGLIAVNKVDFHASENEIVGLIGPNGAGKTTLFNVITGVYPPTAGTIIFDGHAIAGMLPSKVTDARHRPHLPEHPPVQRDDGARERDGRPALPLARGRCCGVILRTPGGHAHGEGASATRAWNCSTTSACGGHGAELGQEPPLRLAAAARDRPGAGHRAESAPARRAGGGHEPAGDRRPHGAHPPDPRARA